MGLKSRLVVLITKKECIQPPPSRPSLGCAPAGRGLASSASPNATTRSSRCTAQPSAGKGLQLLCYIVISVNYWDPGLLSPQPPCFLNIFTLVIQTQNSTDCCHSTPKILKFSRGGYPPNPPVYSTFTPLLSRLKIAQIVAIHVLFFFALVI